MNKCWFRSKMKASSKSRFRSCSLVTYGTRKHTKRRDRKPANEHEAKSFTCPSAGPMTAAAPEHAFRVAGEQICEKQSADFVPLRLSFALANGAVSASE